jgi:hypothetical protein
LIRVSEVTVSSKQLFVSILVGWAIAVAAGFGTRVSFSRADVSAVELAGWVFLAIAPVFTALILARGRTDRSIAQVLYDVERGGDQRRSR